MIITKLGHSCLIVEENGTRILIDPGTYTFKVSGQALDRIKNINAIFITHGHPDHCDLELLPTILEQNNNPLIHTNGATKALLKERAIHATPISNNESITIGAITVQAIDCPHGTLPEPIPTPECTGFLFNNKLFHPGDCHAPVQPVKAEVLALPVIAPWGTTTAAAAFAKHSNPKIVIPIHDAIVRYPELIHGMLTKVFAGTGITFRPLGPGDQLELP